jgi:hypothetical protein
LEDEDGCCVGVGWETVVDGRGRLELAACVAAATGVVSEHGTVAAGVGMGGGAIDADADEDKAAMPKDVLGLDAFGFR